MSEGPPEGARLGALLAALGISWKQVAPIAAAFPGEAEGYAEFSVSDHDASLGIMVRGEEQDFTDRVVRFMAERGVSEERLQRFRTTAEHFEHKNLFVKAEADTRGITELSWYFRRRPRVEVAIEWLRAEGIQDADFVMRVAGLLGKPTVHFVAVSESLGPEAGSSLAKLYFSQPNTPQAWQRLGAVAGLCAVSAEWASFQANAEGLQGLFSFLSIGWENGRRVPGFKLDVHELTGATLGRILRGASSEVIQRIHLLLALHDKELVDYAGFRLRPGQGLRTKVYAAR